MKQRNGDAAAEKKRKTKEGQEKTVERKRNADKLAVKRARKANDKKQKAISKVAD